MEAGMRFSLFMAWGVAIWFTSYVADLASVDGRIAFGVGGVAFGVLYAIHFRRAWERLHHDG
jgi:hypothetical protein